MRIWEYILRVDDLQFVDMPKGAKLLDVQIQNGEPCLWALVDPSGVREQRAIYMRETEIEGSRYYLAYDATLVKDLDYVATFQMPYRKLFIHVFA